MDVYLKKSCLQNIYSVNSFFSDKVNPLSDKRLTGGLLFIYLRVCSKHKLFSNGNSLRFCRPINRRA